MKPLSNQNCTQNLMNVESRGLTPNVQVKSTLSKVCLYIKDSGQRLGVMTQKGP